MPQEHYVLRCFSCGTFQAHIVKKTKKWECKMCGAKQSVKRTYGRGSGKDCRNHVMKLNELRFRNECSFNETETGTSDDDLILPELEQFDPNKPTTFTTFSSKWEKYLDKPVTEPDIEIDDSGADFSVEVKEKKKKRVIEMPENYSNKSPKVCWESNADEACSSVKNCLLSPESDQRNFKSFITEKNATEKDSSVQSKNKFKKLSKYAKYMNEDDEDEDKDDEGFKVSRNDVAKKSLSIFDSESTDLNKILNF